MLTSKNTQDMKNSNLVTILMMMFLLLILRSCNVLETVSRKSLGIGALAFIVVLVAVVL